MTVPSSAIVIIAIIIGVVPDGSGAACAVGRECVQSEWMCGLRCMPEHIMASISMHAELTTCRLDYTQTQSNADHVAKTTSSQSVQCFCRAEWRVVGVDGECSLSTGLFRRLRRAVSEVVRVSLTCGVVHRTTVTSPFVLTAAMASARVFSSSPMPTANDAPTMAAATASLTANRGMAGSSQEIAVQLFSAHQSHCSSRARFVCAIFLPN